MPSRNIYKILVKGGIYHVYNRGVEKRKIFLNVDDYKVFLQNLKIYLTNPEDQTISLKQFTLQGTTFKGIPRQPNNYFRKIELLAYCLMPNHFHFLIKQLDEKSLSSFMKSITVNYSMYFNKKYDRVGQLLQGRYKAVMVDNDNYLLHLSRYIHLNPSEYNKDLVNSYSSYGDYLKVRSTIWVNPKFILDFFLQSKSFKNKKVYSYKSFVEDCKIDSADVLGKLRLD